MRHSSPTTLERNTTSLHVSPDLERQRRSHAFRPGIHPAGSRRLSLSLGPRVETSDQVHTISRNIEHVSQEIIPYLFLKMNLCRLSREKLSGRKRQLEASTSNENLSRPKNGMRAKIVFSVKSNENRIVFIKIKANASTESKEYQIGDHINP